MGDRRIAVEAGIHLDHRVEVLAPREWREADPVDADDLGRDPLADLGLVPRVVEDDEAAMAVQVDEARGDDPSRGVDRAGGVRGFGSGRDEPEALPIDHDRPRPAGHPGPIHDGPPDDDDVGHVSHAGGLWRATRAWGDRNGQRTVPRRAHAYVRWSDGACDARIGHRSPLGTTRASVRWSLRPWDATNGVECQVSEACHPHGMPPRERAVDRGGRLARHDLRTIGPELRNARVARGLTTAEVAAVVGLSRSHVGRIERAVHPAATVAQLARIGAVVGLDVRVRAYPGPAPTRDAGQLKLMRDLPRAPALGPQDGARGACCAR